MKSLTKRACFISGLLLLLCLISILCIVLGRNKASRGNTVHIYLDGTLIQSVDLETVKNAYTIELSGIDGGHNLLEISPEGVRMLKADCPDQICVHQGRIQNTLIPITCLPHKIVVTLEEAQKTDSVTY